MFSALPTDTKTLTGASCTLQVVAVWKTFHIPLEGQLDKVIFNNQEEKRTQITVSFFS